MLLKVEHHVQQIFGGPADRAQVTQKAVKGAASGKLKQCRKTFEPVNAPSASHILEL
jgi:hypothetical protein